MGVFHQAAPVGVVVLFGRRAGDPGFLIGLKEVQGEGLQVRGFDFRFHPNKDFIPEFQGIERRGGDQQSGIEMGGLQLFGRDQVGPLDPLNG